MKIVPVLPKFSPIWLGVILAGILSLIPFLAWAQNADEAWQAMNKKDYATAKLIFQQLAEKGDPDGEYGLGYLYWKGLGGAVDIAKAIDQFRLAAENGSINAKLKLGYAYFHGVGVPLDLAQAEYWYQQGADAGQAEGYNTVAFIWAIQDKNLPQALELVELALLNDPQEPEIKDTKGWILFQMKAYDQAFQFICLAVLAKPGDAELRVHLGDVYWELGLTQKAKQEWLEGLALGESPYAATNSSEQYIYGHGVENKQQAFQRRLQQLETPNPQTNPPPQNQAQYDCLQPIS